MTKPYQHPTIAPGPDWLCECGKENDYLRSRCYCCSRRRERSEIKPEPAPWRSMKLAPTSGPVVWVLGQLADGSEVRMHFACDLSGEEQPPFKGWFQRIGEGPSSYMTGVIPLRWRPEA